MKKLTKASSCPDMLTFEKLDKDIGAAGDGADTKKLNVNAIEFVPRENKKGDENSNSNSNSNSKTNLNVNAEEFVPRKKKDAWTQVNAEYDEGLGPMEVATLNHWKNYLTFPIKVGNDNQLVLLNDTQYMIVPCLNSADKQKGGSFGEISSTSSTESHSFAERIKRSENRRKSWQERRRQNERQKAVDALKLTEQRRSRVLEPSNPVIHLSRSPVRYTAKERKNVGHLRNSKRLRVEEVLREMSEERKQEKQPGQKKTDSSSSSSPPELPSGSSPKSSQQSTSKPARRYIPTVKEWDEHRRAKAQGERKAKRKAKRQAKWKAKQEAKSSSSMQESSLECATESSMESPMESPTEWPMEMQMEGTMEWPLEMPTESRMESPLEWPMEMPMEGFMEVPLQMEGGDLVAVQHPDVTPHDRPTTSNGNVTNSRYLMNPEATQEPQDFENGGPDLRYSMQELRQLRIVYKDLKMDDLEDKFQGMGFLYK